MRQLLNHSGGLPDYGSLEVYRQAVRESPQQPWTDDQFLRYTLAQGMAFPLGAGWGYSNLGLAVVFRLVDVLAGWL